MMLWLHAGLAQGALIMRLHELLHVIHRMGQRIVIALGALGLQHMQQVLRILGVVTSSHSEISECLTLMGTQTVMWKPSLHSGHSGIGQAVAMGTESPTRARSETSHRA